jgi:hypothetical protein
MYARGDDVYLQKLLKRAFLENQPVSVVPFLVSENLRVLEMTLADTGYLPLHVALSCRRDVSLEVVQFLVEQCPAAAKRTDCYGHHTPVHLACMRQPPLRLIQLLIGHCPGAFKMKDNFSRTPFHFACSHGASFDVVKLLADAEAVGMVDNDNRTPLHWACCNISPSLEVI